MYLIWNAKWINGSKIVFFSYKSYFGATTSHGRKYSMKTLKKTSAYCAQGLIIAPGPWNTSNF